MNPVHTHAQPGASGNQSADPTPEPNVLCIECRALYPASHYGVAKYSAGGKAKACPLCKAQYLRLQRQAKGAQSKVDDSIIRNVLRQNRKILSLASQLDTSTCDFECRAFSTVTKVDYKVFMGKSASLGLSCICLFSLDGTMLRELSYSGSLSNIQAEIISFLKALNIRLELTEADAIAAKTLIYYI